MRVWVSIDVCHVQVSFTGLMHWVGAVLSQNHPELGNCKLWLLSGVDSGSRQQALPNTNDFLCCEPGLWHLSAHHPSLLHHCFHLSPTLSLQCTSTPSTHGLPLILPPSPSLCPLAHSSPLTGAWITQCFTRITGNLPSPPASAVPSHLPLLLLPSFDNPLALPPTHQFLLIPLTPLSPPGPNSGCPRVGAKARKERGWWLLAEQQKTERTFTGNSISGWITLSCALLRSKKLAMHF